MSDSTKKSIIINQSFLSGSNKSNSSSNNKQSKKSRPRLSDEIIKPNKLKKMLLDKINAKRKAEQTSSFRTANDNVSNTDIDVSKESKLFSSEFKKSLEFLDNYINTKNQNPRIKKSNDNNHSKTLKRQNNGSGSLTNDILKSIQSSKNSKIQPLQQQPNIAQVYTPTVIQPHTGSSPQIVMPNIQPSISNSNIPAPMFQKIQLQIPQSQVINPRSSNHLAGTVPTQPKINLEIGKSSSENMIYTELPPELQLNTSTSSLPMDATILNTHSVPITGEIQEINNQDLINESIYNDNDNDDDYDDITGKTSITTSTLTFSPVKLLDDAPYGCLKNGKKPTFRAYNKTIKHNIRINDDNNDDNPQTERQTKLKELQDKHKRQSFLNGEHTNSSLHDETNNDKSHSKHSHMSRTKIRKHLRKTITKKFKLGKQGNVVGVLIKNNDTRKNIQREHGLLKNKKLSEIKKYLVEKNLIKIGSMAPPNIVRKIYEDAMLTGEIENVGKGVILHNFLEDKKSW